MVGSSECAASLGSMQPKSANNPLAKDQIRCFRRTPHLMTFAVVASVADLCAYQGPVVAAPQYQRVCPEHPAKPEITLGFAFQNAFVKHGSPSETS